VSGRLVSEPLPQPPLGLDRQHDNEPKRDPIRDHDAFGDRQPNTNTNANASAISQLSGVIVIQRASWRPPMRDRLSIQRKSAYPIAT